ncbi:phosphatidylinositol mannoside acyltransferase [uncultured Pseudokineococcus sp.]|uniref:phosphatidylinositol mannoside acyltransferase n=1 Tax=uncultured Pseudokineococcus sp. TaxID=1642928 RepID=UPI00262923F8|nr:phosphatidylinositol mannoside acyltransferase [uncultured Pseudokineococcus sp.]
MSAPLLVVWRAVAALPEPVARTAGDLAADAVWRLAVTPGVRGARPLAGVRQLRSNLALTDPGRPPRAARRLLRAALRSYARYWVDLFRLERWPEDRRRRAVRLEEDDALRAALADGRGAVVALSHSASWDVMGAYAALELAPVTTVAERLADDDLHAAFRRVRTALGVEALPLSGGAPPLPALVRRVRAGGFVPLLVDRDLGGAAVEVDLLGGRARVASGAAALADLAGAPLFALEAWYDRDPSVPGGWVVRGRPHPVERVTDGPRPERVARTTQRVADVLGAAVARHPQDWHVLQPVLLPPTAGTRTAGTPTAAAPAPAPARAGSGEGSGAS